MSSPLQIQITDLPTAPSVSNTDYTIIRQAGADYKVQIGLLREIDVSAYPSINTPSPNDLMLINRGGVNYSVRFDRVGFVAGTVFWFYQDTQPSGWQIVDGLGDSLLGVVGGSNLYQNFGLRGNWQQNGHALTIDQIPSHAHRVLKTKSTTGSSNNLGPVRGSDPDTGSFLTEPTGGQGSTGTGGPANAPTVPHNHGNTWRPLANVGILCRKL